MISVLLLFYFKFGICDVCNVVDSTITVGENGCKFIFCFIFVFFIFLYKFIIFFYSSVKTAFDIVAPSSFTISPMKIYIVNGDYSDYEFEALNNDISLTIEGESRENTIFTALYSNIEKVANDTLLNGTIRIWAGANLTIESITFKFDQTLTTFPRNLIEVDVNSYSYLTLVDVVVQEFSSLLFITLFFFFLFFILFIILFSFLAGSNNYKWGALSLKGYSKFIARDNVFLDCRASSGDNGAAIFVKIPPNTYSEVVNCSFTNCSTLEGGDFSNGGAIFAQGRDYPIVNDSILVSNCSFFECFSKTGGAVSFESFIFFI
jgi:hypothetical protein